MKKISKNRLKWVVLVMIIGFLSFLLGQWQMFGFINLPISEGTTVAMLIAGFIALVFALLALIRLLSQPTSTGDKP